MGMYYAPDWPKQAMNHKVHKQRADRAPTDPSLTQEDPPKVREHTPYN